MLPSVPTLLSIFRSTDRSRVQKYSKVLKHLNIPHRKMRESIKIDEVSLAKISYNQLIRLMDHGLPVIGFSKYETY